MKKLLIIFVLTVATPAFAAPKKVVMIAGKPSHGPLSHEHNAGIQLLANCLEEGAAKLVTPAVTLNGWPSDESILDGADAIVIYSDGGGRHPALQGGNLAKLDKLMAKGVGFLTIHYAVEPTTNKGNKEFLDWQGGCFETHWSVNPHWTANFSKLPRHPITRGVKPFKANDEWYFHMRFVPGMKGVTPILSDVAPAATMKRGDGAHSGNPHVRKTVAAGASANLASGHGKAQCVLTIPPKVTATHATFLPPPPAHAHILGPLRHVYEPAGWPRGPLASPSTATALALTLSQHLPSTTHLAPNAPPVQLRVGLFQQLDPVLPAVGAAPIHGRAVLVHGHEGVDDHLEPLAVLEETARDHTVRLPVVTTNEQVIEEPRRVRRHRRQRPQEPAIVHRALHDVPPADFLQEQLRRRTLPRNNLLLRAQPLLFTLSPSLALALHRHRVVRAA